MIARNDRTLDVYDLAGHIMGSDPLVSLAYATLRAEWIERWVARRMVALWRTPVEQFFPSEL